MLYQHKGSPFWQFDFQWRGHRFHGSTKRTSKREAAKVEAAERDRARAHVAQIEAARTSLRLDDIAGRYWQEVGQHHAGSKNTEHNIALLIEFFGKDKLLTEITGDDVTKLVAWRRGHRARTSGLISHYTINHTTEQLRKLFTRAKLWGVRFEHEPRWTKHMLAVPVERVRELSDAEADRLDAAMRDDYAPFFGFMEVTGWRLKACLLKWCEVNWDTNQIVKLGKGGKRITRRITSDVREILWPLYQQRHHPELVFTFVCQHGENGRVRGQRYPITYTGVQAYWKRLRRQAGVADFRIHDYRHNFATKLLRQERDIRLVQKALDHTSIKTTTRYAHVLDEDVAAALERVAKSRNKSRARLKVV